MKLQDVKTCRKTFKAESDTALVSKVMEVVTTFNIKYDEAPTTRQVSNVYHGTQTYEDAIKAVDKSVPTAIQDSILQGVLNPQLGQKRLLAAFGQGNEKVWYLPPEVIARHLKK